MARLRGPDHRIVTLRPNHMVGRADGCDLQCARPRVSGRHAVIRWNGSDWTVRDLNSTNGTWLDGNRLGPSDEEPLTPGQRLIFGIRDETWVVEDVEAPVALAEPVLGGPAVHAEGDLLALPDDENPVVVIHAGERGWTVERDGEVEPVPNGGIVEIDGAAWRLYLPDATVTTEFLDRVPASILGIDLEVLHSLDEEIVELRIREEGNLHIVPHRAHHELLLQLARTRIEDAESDEVPAVEAGWVHRDLVLKQLQITPNALYQQIHRARREFQRLGWPDGATIIERRPGQMRLGVPRVRVALLGEEDPP